MYPRETLQAFDRLIARRGLRLDAIVVGGAALNLLGVISRETKGCDILHPSLGDLRSLPSAIGASTSPTASP